MNPSPPIWKFGETVRKLRCAVIGLGIGRRHVETLIGEGCEVVALCDTNPSRAKEVVSSFSLPTYPKLLNSWQEVLEIDGLDLVVVATPDKSHFELNRQFLEAGISVFSEKPAATSLTEINSLKNILRNGDQVGFGCNFRLRNEPWVLNLKSRIDQLSFGELISARFTYWYGRRGKIMSGWRGEDSEYSPILGGGIHVYDLALYLLGDSWTASSTKALKSTVCNPIHHYDFASSSITMETVAHVEVTTNFASYVDHMHGVELVGTKGSYLRHPEQVNSAHEANYLSNGNHRSAQLRGLVDKLRKDSRDKVDWLSLSSTELALVSQQSLQSGEALKRSLGNNN